MSHTENQLLIPPDAIADPTSVEIVRARIVDGGLQCSLKLGVWDDVSTWGLLLADIAKYVADAQAKEQGIDKSKTIELLREMFNDELDQSTCESEGDFVS